MNNILNRLGYYLKKTLKCKPLRKIPQTDAIFTNVAQRHQEAKQDKGILRISIDTKAIVKIGELSRNGYNRLKTPLKTTDHDQMYFFVNFLSKCNHSFHEKTRIGGICFAIIKVNQDGMIVF